MKIFISWSGERSHLLAKALREWLPLVIYFVEPWLSQSDIEAGERWANEVSKELEVTHFGIICLTRENSVAPWILFESGALAKSLQQGRVIPLLLNMEFKDIAGPLAQFQAKKIDRNGLLELVNSINKASEHHIPDSRIAQLFEMAWPSISNTIEAIPKAEASAKQNRSQSEILEELVSGVRGMEMRFREVIDDGSRFKRRRSSMNPIMIEEMIGRSRLGRRDPVRFLIIASALRETFPWIYELGLEAYRAGNESNGRRKMETQARFFDAVRMLRRGPFLEEAGVDKATYMMIREIEHLAEELDEPSLSEEVQGKEQEKS